MAEPGIPSNSSAPAGGAPSRPPRLHITYQSEIGGKVENRELGFIVGVLANLTGQPEEPLPRLRDRKFVEVNTDNFDAVMYAMKPHLAFWMENKLSDDPDAPKLKCDLRFRSLSDFEPDNVARQVKPLGELLALRRQLSDLRGMLQGNDRLEEGMRYVIESKDKMELFRLQAQAESDGQEGASRGEAADTRITAQIWESARGSPYSPQRERGEQLLGVFFGQVESGEMTISRDIEAMINARTAQIDHLLSIQLNEILHYPDVQMLEASWRGLRYLLDKTPPDPLIRFRVLNVSKKELLRDLQRAPEFDQSALFASVYEEEYAVFGGEPFSVLVGDYYFSRHPEDTELLERISNVAAAAHAPFISAAAPELFGLDSYLNLRFPRDLSRIFDSSEYAKWQSFRVSEDAIYVGLVLPRMLMRLPYDGTSNAAHDFVYDERVDGSDHTQYLWGNSAYAFASRLTSAFARFGWAAAISGVSNGGIVEDLPTHMFETDDGDRAMKCPTEVAISDRRERELAQLGFIPLIHCKNTNYACFFSGNSVRKPRVEEREAPVAHGWEELRYVFAVSRFAHYLKVIMRDQMGGFMSRQDVEKALNLWISNYVVNTAKKDGDSDEPRPLREARLEVTEAPGRPGDYTAILHLQPALQLQPLTTPFRLVAELPHSKW